MATTNDDDRTRCPQFIGREGADCTLCGFPQDGHGDTDDDNQVGA